MLTSLTYISRSGLEPESPDIQDLWYDAMARNESIGVTGALYFDGQCFVQYIEGEEDDVGVLYERIAQDERHSDIFVIAQADLTSTRMFGAWHLKLIDGSRSKPLQRMFVYDEMRALTPAQASKIPFKLLRL